MLWFKSDREKGLLDEIGKLNTQVISLEDDLGGKNLLIDSLVSENQKLAEDLKKHKELALKIREFLIDAKDMLNI